MRLEIHGVNYGLNDDLKAHVERRLHFALGRLAARIDRVTVRFSDLNGPRGGIDKQCRIVVNLIPRGVVRLEGTGDDPFTLVDRAAKRVGRSVGRALERRRRVTA